MGSVRSGYGFVLCLFSFPIFSKMNTLPSPAARPYIDAIRSGAVYCHCSVDREAAELVHDSDCRWQNYIEQIYRIGRAEDARQAEKNPEEVCRPDIHEKGDRR